MIKWLYNNYKPLPPVYLDGLLYVAIAFFAALTACLSTEDATKYLGATVLFYAHSGCSVISASLLALKMYRSTAFAEHQQAKQNLNSPTPIP